MIDEPAVAAAVRSLLVAIGEDPAREGLRDTPRRVARFWADLLTTKPFPTLTTFDADGMDQMVVQTRIPFHALCEHHLLPFVGYAAVGYIPTGRIVGLSKLARLVRHYAYRPTNQERVTVQVADALQDALSPLGVGVVVRARHLCMEMRGADVDGAVTTTSALRGVFMDHARDEFLRVVMGDGSWIV